MPVGILVALLLVGCVIPPPFEIEKQDAAVNSPPAILSVSSDQQALPEPGPVHFDVGRTAGTLSVSLLETDTTDKLFVRIFVDYNMPNRLDARVRCEAPQSLDPMRTTTCVLSSLCLEEDVGVQRSMLIMVFDRQPLENSDQEPPFQAMPSGGLFASRFYFLRCQPKPT